MKSNYAYPKTEIEFFQRQYSIDQLVDTYTIDQLMAYYSFGVNTIRQLDRIIDGNLYETCEVTPEKVDSDKMYLVLRCAIVKNAVKQLSVEPIEIGNLLFKVNLN